MITLQSMLAESNSIESSLEASEGEITPELEARLATLDSELPEKVDIYGFIMDRIEMEAAFWKEKASEADALCKRHTKLLAAFRERLKHMMITNEKETLQGNQTKFKISPCKPSLVVTNEETIPTNYFDEKVMLKLNNAKLKADLESGIKIDGADLIGGVSLRKTSKTGLLK